MSNDRAQASHTPIAMEPGVKQLFLDDYVVAETADLERTLHRPERRGPVIKPDRSWSGGQVAALSVPIWIPEEGVYKWIYRPNYKNLSGLAVSKDGLNWEKPILGLVEFRGSKENNLVSDRTLYKVVRDPFDPDPERRYKGLAKNTPVVSADLVHWRDAGAPDVPGGDSGSITCDEVRKRILLPLKISDAGKESYRQFELMTSPDFKSWSEPSFLFAADEEDQRIAVERIRRWLSDPGRPRPLFVEPPPHAGWIPPADIRDLPKRRHSWNAQCQNISVFPYHGLYVALITLLYPTGAYRPNPVNTSAFFMVEVASTRDMTSWNRFREPFLSPAGLDHGVAENFERMMVQPVNRPIERDGELWFYYSGMKEHQGFEGSRYGSGRYEVYMDGTPRTPESLSDVERADIAAGQSAIYLAVLRLDGFASLDAGSEEGHLLTKSLALSSGNLFLNARCGASGAVNVEIIGESGGSVAVSHPISGDGVRLPVRWKPPCDLSSLAARPVRIKIRLRDASLYALWTE